MDVGAVLWCVALVLDACAVLWMFGLIALRVLSEQRKARRAADRRAVEAALIAVMQRKPEAAQQLAVFAGRGRLMAEVILEFLSLIHGDDREAILAVLRDLAVDATLRGRLDRGSLAGRLACVEGLAAFPGPANERALLRMAGSTHPRLRLSALRALAEMGAPPDIATVVDDLVRGALQPSGALADLLLRVAGADPAAAVRAAARPDLPPTVRVLVLEALGGAGDYGALPLLCDCVAAPEPSVRVAAIHALGRLKHPASAAALTGALDDPEGRVRAAACEAAGAARLAALAEALHLRLDDPVWTVRFHAATALAALGPAATRRPAPQPVPFRPAEPVRPPVTGLAGRAA